MIAGVLLAGALLGRGAAPAAPEAVTIATVTGEVEIAVAADAFGAPVIAAPALAAALGTTVRLDGPWAELTVSRQLFRFLVGAHLYSFGNRVRPLSGQVSLVRDTVLIPFHFISEILPRHLSERFRYDAAAARLVEAGARPPVKRLPNGLRPGHIVTVDPGHGGVDPGNPGLYFPKGVREKDVTLQIGLLLREALQERGVGVRMTRSTDTLIALADRGSYCTEACDLFVSLHVNSLARRRGYTAVRGFETYFLAEAKTEDAARVARMENDAVRFEPIQENVTPVAGLEFIMKDLQLNEYLRESAVLASLVQGGLDKVHDGDNRGVKQAGFMVLTTARRPAVLVELGYSTNPKDGRLLTSRTKQKAMAAALADAIVEYLKNYERRVGQAPGLGLQR